MTPVEPGQPAQSVEMGGSALAPPALSERDLYWTRVKSADPPPHAFDMLRVVHVPTGVSARLDVEPGESYMQARHRLLGLITEAVHARPSITHDQLAESSRIEREAEGR